MRSILASLLLFGSSLLGATAATRPSEDVSPDSCVTADCHANIKSTPVLHGPIGSNACGACHELVDAEDHRYQLTRQGADLCTYCHEFDVEARPVVHKPVSTGQCLGCHDPHGGRDRTMTREASMKALCARCHESVTKGHTFAHTPVEKGQCESCHPPHAAMFPKLLDAVDADLCLACHTKFETTLASTPVRHKALEKGCLECHAAHATDQANHVKQPTVELCTRCHEKTRNQIAQASHTHSPTEKDRACLTCHTAHGSTAVKLLASQPISLCLECHKKEIRVDKRRVIPAMAGLADPSMHKHGAIKDGQCSGCHTPHGGKEPHLLTKSYTRSFYAPFDIGQYELCFSCHDARLVKSELAGGATAFRNGDRNLHWIHVREGLRGRACFVCHTTHASPNERNVRQTVTFKAWNMPIRFSKTETGGVCKPGCHESLAYDREKPVPTTRPVITAPPTAPRVDDLVAITVSAKDLLGNDLKLPDTNRPAVLLFLGTDQLTDEPLMQAVAQSVGKPDEVKVVVVWCGPDAGTSQPSVGWPVIVDQEAKLSHQLEVYGWPTAIVLQADGVQVARVGGSAESLAYKLPRYVKVAQQTLDRVAAERQLASNVIATEGPRPHEQARQSIDMARQLIAAEKWNEARRILNAVVIANPEQADAHYLLGTLDERAGDWPNAATHYRKAKELVDR